MIKEVISVEDESYENLDVSTLASAAWRRSSILPLFIMNGYQMVIMMWDMFNVWQSQGKPHKTKYLHRCTASTLRS